MMDRTKDVSRPDRRRYSDTISDPGVLERVCEPTEKKWKALKLCGIFGIILTICGIILINISYTYTVNLTEHSDGTINSIKILKNVTVDYTDCVEERLFTCHNLLSPRVRNCDCLPQPFKLESPLLGDIILYYQLDTFTKTPLYKENNYSLRSRDDRQLLGDLSQAPNDSCQPFVVNDGKPIAPCGAIADAMFQDEYEIKYERTNIVPLLNFGIVSDVERRNFKNPPGELKIAFQNYSRPASWEKDIWELDTTNSDNNGFQNEQFIGWMSSQEPSAPKPALRLNRSGLFADGLPAGNYSVTIKYADHPPAYRGPRKLVLASVEYEYQLTQGYFALGLSFLLIGILMSVPLLYCCFVNTCMFLLMYPYSDVRTGAGANAPAATEELSAINENVN